MEKNLLVLLCLLYLGAFVARNLVVKARTGMKVKAGGSLLNASIVLSALCILAALISTYSDRTYGAMGAIASIRYPAVSALGLALFAASILLGWLISARLKDSWRVGIHADQQTPLVQGGIYARIRNPYFLNYYLMFLGLWLVRPSLVLAVLILVTVAVFHRMVLNEEKHLLKIHGKNYLAYLEKTGRYLPRARRP